MSATTRGAGTLAPEITLRPMLRLNQLRAVMFLSIRNALRAKRLWVMGTVCALPAAFPLLHILLSPFFRNIGRFPPSMQVFEIMVGLAYFHIILYLLTLAYGLGVVSEEEDGQTLIYLVLRPVPRWVLVVGRYLAAWIVTIVLMVVGMALTYVMVFVAQRTYYMWGDIMALSNLMVLRRNMIVLIVALAAYLALFAFMGAYFKHGERWGVVFCFGWEFLMTYLPARLKWFTLMYHVQTLAPQYHKEGKWAKLLSLRGDPLSKSMALLVLFLVVVVCLTLTVWILKRKEVR